MGYPPGGIIIFVGLWMEYKKLNEDMGSEGAVFAYCLIGLVLHGVLS